MNGHVLQLCGEIVLDARRAAWLPASGALAVADPHLGEAWARRARGQLVPVPACDEAVPRLEALIRDYRPHRTVILGDIVHAALPLDGIEQAVRSLAGLGNGNNRIELCLGNHDRHLSRHLRVWKIDVSISDQIDLPEAVLFHGDRPPQMPAADMRWRIQGHEHPAMVLGDGVATHAKVPCFLVGRCALVLPAFSDWAGGCVIGRDAFLGETARGTEFNAAIACLGKRLLRVPLNRKASTAPSR